MPRQQLALTRWGAIAISILAGAWTLFHLFWAEQKHTADDYWGQALLVLFVLALLLAFLHYFQSRAALIATTPNDQFPEPALARYFLATNGPAAMWFVLRMDVGAEWLLAGVDKIQMPTVWGTSGVGIKGFVTFALTKASGQNPSVQGWYASFLQHVVLPNAGLFSFLVTWGEFAVGLGVLLGALTGIAAGFGLLMNMNYLLAGTVSINPVLGMFGLFLVIAWRVAGQIGLDRWLLPIIGLPWKPGSLFQPQTAARATP